ncbi:zinc finger, CCHC-type containing protein, partial [Tanacetum coccineum]
TESRVLGVVVRLPDPKLKTLGKRGIECIFVGYAKHSKAFRFYVIEPNESVAINSIIESMDAIFDENRFSSVSRPSLRIPNGTEDIGGSVVLEEVTEEVIQGFKQKSGIDYFDTYAPVAHINTIRLLIAMSLIHNLIIHQMDVKTAFLNEELEEDVYMNQPKFHKSGQGVIIYLYVDDMLIFGSDQVLVDLTKEVLSSSFSMKDMGEADVTWSSKIVSVLEWIGRMLQSSKKSNLDDESFA